jgi:predicted RNA binding protein YcfA (HicA-like mRNA interferase family)
LHFGKDSCLEEGLANAVALKKVWSTMRDRDVMEALIKYVDASPAGYRMGTAHLPHIADVRAKFAEENHNICFPRLPSKNPELWKASTFMFSGISNVKSRVNYVVRKGSPLLSRLRFRPLLPPGKLITKLSKAAGLSFERHGARHDIYRTSAGDKIEIPRHAKDLGTGLVRKILKESGLNMGIEQFLQTY